MTIIRLLPILLFVFVISCKEKPKDPNAQVDEGSFTGETYTSRDIGWTIEIPKGFTVTSKDQVDAQEKKGLKMIENATNTQINTRELKNLLSFSKNKFNLLTSTSQPFQESYEGEYEANIRAMPALLYQTFAAQGVRTDTATGSEKIQGLDFRTVYTTVYGKDGNVILRQNIYTRLMKGYDFNVVISYNNEDDKDAMVNTFRKSKFE